LECGDLSPLCRRADWSARQNRVQRFGKFNALRNLDGDKSPAESGDKSPHSKVSAALPL